MVARSARVFLVVATLSIAFTSDARASCSDRPGTPDNVSARGTSERSIQFSWRNTATENVWWDIEVTDETGRTVLSQAGIGRGATGYHLPAENTYSVEPGTTRCFRIKA